MNELISRIPAKALTLTRLWLPVACALVFFGLWTQAESGRYETGKEVDFVMWAIAIALAGVAPWAALGLTVAIPLAQALYLLSWPDSTAWPAWLATTLIVGYVAATNSSWRWRITALVVGAISAIGYGVLLIESGWMGWVGVGNDPRMELAKLASALLAAVVVAWLIAVGLAALWRVAVVSSVLTRTTARLDDTDFELRLAHDRGRISRDIHDSLAHSLAIVLAQAEGAAAIHELRPDATPEALGNIAAVSRAALIEVRRLVERISDEDISEHTSRIDHIPALVEDVGHAGVTAQLRVLGRIGEVSLSKQVAVYRIVQESLTNVLKHRGRGATATVTLDAQGAGLAVLVVSSGGDGRPLVPAEEGRGIGVAGMKERARLVGGWLTAVPGDDETFVVTGFVPPDAEIPASGDTTQSRVDGPRELEGAFHG